VNIPLISVIEIKFWMVIFYLRKAVNKIYNGKNTSRNTDYNTGNPKAPPDTLMILLLMAVTKKE